MKKVIVLGSAGMAGHVIAAYLSKLGEYKVFGVARSDAPFLDKKIDVSNLFELKKYIETVAPDFVINCIGILVKGSEDAVCSAIQINSHLPHWLATNAKKNHYKLIHISTDCVFSGKDGNYVEESLRDGDTFYARTKALGEVVNKSDLTIRTSIIGAELKENGTGLLDWFLKQDGEIIGFSQVFWSGVTTLELAKAINQMIQQEIVGLYHLCPGHKISKFELLNIFSMVWKKEVVVRPNDQIRCDKSLVCTRTDFDYEVKDFVTMCIEFYDWMQLNEDKYSHYLKKE